MSLFICALNSGSNANCYYIGNQDEAVLVDAGLTCKETELRMQRLNLNMKQVKAIFISHEHSDHIRGLPVIARKYQLPVYITPATLRSGKQQLPPHLLRDFTACEPVKIGRLQVTAFPKYHDAVEPHSFMISFNQINVGVFTDIGMPCAHVIRYFSTCHAAFLETNYDEELLHNGAYPYYLKNRIRSGKGHLSNTQALTLFHTHRPPYLSHLILSHLSKDNNCPDRVQALFEAQAGNTKIIVASRYMETAIFEIENTLKAESQHMNRANCPI